MFSYYSWKFCIFKNGTKNKYDFVAAAMANDSSKAITLKDVAATPGDLDTILVIQAGSSDYKQYNYFGDTWYGPNGADADDDTIAPGEAFYYFKRN